MVELSGARAVSQALVCVCLTRVALAVQVSVALALVGALLDDASEVTSVIRAPFDGEEIRVRPCNVLPLGPPRPVHPADPRNGPQLRQVRHFARQAALEAFFKGKRGQRQLITTSMVALTDYFATRGTPLEEGHAA